MEFTTSGDSNGVRKLHAVVALRHQCDRHDLKLRIMSTFTCFDDVAQLIEQEFVVSSSVQALHHVAVEFVHHTLHICVLVLLDTRRTDIATPQLCINTEIEFQHSARATTEKKRDNNLQSVLHPV